MNKESVTGMQLFIILFIYQTQIELPSQEHMKHSEKFGSDMQQSPPSKLQAGMFNSS